MNCNMKIVVLIIMILTLIFGFMKLYYFSYGYLQFNAAHEEQKHNDEFLQKSHSIIHESKPFKEELKEEFDEKVAIFVLIVI